MMHRSGPLSRSKLGRFIAVSVMVHAHVALLVAVLLSTQPDLFAPRASGLLASNQPVDISLLSDKEKDAVLEEKLKALEQQEEKEEKKEKDEVGQVVTLPRPAEEKRPDKSKFLSEYDSTVAKETKSKLRSAVGEKSAQAAAAQSADAAKSSQAVNVPAVPPVPGNAQAMPDKRAVKAMSLAMRSADSGKTESALRGVASDKLGDLRLSELPEETENRESKKGDGQTDDKRQGEQSSEGKASAQAARPGMRALQLTASEASRIVGSSGINDAISDVEEGEQTLLNSKRWRYASFFNRVKTQVAQNWHPDRAYLRRDPNGNVYGFRDRLTVLHVNLTPAGKLASVHIAKDCGVDFLDDEAVTAFRAAEPFPNPPKGLIDDKTGLISFRFGFLFELSGQSAFRVLRSAGN